MHVRCSRLVGTGHGEGLVGGCSEIRSTIILIAVASPPICRGLSVAKQHHEGGHKTTGVLPYRAQPKHTDGERANPDGLVGLDLGMPSGDSGSCEMREPRSDSKMHAVRRRTV